MYIITLYTLNYYEDKYFISLFVHFKHKIKIYYHRTYTHLLKISINNHTLLYIHINNHSLLYIHINTYNNYHKKYT